jgi:NADH-quinone oxidoreductase subunit I
VGWERDPAGKKALTTYTFDLSRCMFCGLCEDACPTPCLELTQEFELSLYGRRDMKLDRQQLEAGVQPLIYTK